MGYPIPPNYNPADWMLDCAQGVDEQDLEEHGFFQKDERDHSKKGNTLLVVPRNDQHVSSWTELLVLMTREKVSLVRTPPL